MGLVYKVKAMLVKNMNDAKLWCIQTQALTSSWSDGSRGPICFCIPEGALPAKAIREWNKQHIGLSYIVCSGTSSHFMQSDTLLEIFDQCYSAGIALQRAKSLACHFSLLQRTQEKYCTFRSKLNRFLKGDVQSALHSAYIFWHDTNIAPCPRSTLLWEQYSRVLASSNSPNRSFPKTFPKTLLWGWVSPLKIAERSFAMRGRAASRDHGVKSQGGAVLSETEKTNSSASLYLICPKIDFHMATRVCFFT